MRIEDVEALANEFEQVRSHISNVDDPILKAIEALRAEAWYPIERAEEMGAKRRVWVLVFASGEYWDVRWESGRWVKVDNDPLRYSPTHFRFITTPEAR